MPKRAVRIFRLCARQSGWSPELVLLSQGQILQHDSLRDAHVLCAAPYGIESANAAKGRALPLGEPPATAPAPGATPSTPTKPGGHIPTAPDGTQYVSVPSICRKPASNGPFKPNIQGSTCSDNMPKPSFMHFHTLLREGFEGMPIAASHMSHAVLAV